MARSSFALSVVTPEGPALECEAKSAVFPAYDGEIGILPGHAPLLTKLGIGVLRVSDVKGASHRLYVDGGFAQVAGDKLTLLTEQASNLEDLSREDVPALFEKAEAIRPTDDAAMEARDAAYRRARTLQRLTRR